MRVTTESGIYDMWSEIELFFKRIRISDRKYRTPGMANESDIEEFVKIKLQYLHNLFTLILIVHLFSLVVVFIEIFFSVIFK